MCRNCSTRWTCGGFGMLAESGQALQHHKRFTWICIAPCQLKHLMQRQNGTWKV